MAATDISGMLQPQRGGYGEDTPPWVLLQTYFCYGSNPDVKAFPNKDGNEIYLTKHDPFLGTGIWTGHEAGMTSTHPYIISLITQPRKVLFLLLLILVGLL